ncbi:inositol monophosphatase family protein [Candidatus Neomarinimicrobiota bacterium]
MTSAAPNLDHVLDVALAIAHRAGDILMDKFLRLERVSKKGAVDLVTEADLASEREIVMSIRNAFPNHAVIAEEGDYDLAQPSPYRWVIDPLDGTTNYVHGLPIFAVSIGYQHDGDTKVGVVLNPAHNEEYTAIKGKGARLNGEPIKVSQVSQLSESLVVTGFPYTHNDLFLRTFDLFREIYGRCQGGRRLGAAAVDFCYVAAGRFEAFYEAGLNPWDLCAGDLICREAGGKTSDWQGEPIPFSGRRILASNGLIHDQLLDVLNLPSFADIR